MPVLLWIVFIKIATEQRMTNAKGFADFDLGQTFRVGVDAKRGVRQA